LHEIAGEAGQFHDELLRKSPREYGARLAAVGVGGEGGIPTRNFPLARRALWQLSYNPMGNAKSCRWRPASWTSNIRKQERLPRAQGPTFPRRLSGGCGLVGARGFFDRGTKQTGYWCTSQVPSLALLLFRQALSPDQLGVHVIGATQEIRRPWRKSAAASRPTPQNNSPL
jgi:hypothetical protein